MSNVDDLELEVRLAYLRGHAEMMNQILTILPAEENRSGTKLLSNMGLQACKDGSDCPPDFCYRSLVNIANIYGLLPGDDYTFAVGAVAAVREVGLHGSLGKIEVAHV